MQANRPLLTIITAVYNSPDSLEKTIHSVAEQTWLDYEFIVIDGGSKDTTIDIIKKYDKQISRWISEKDNGIYDALNKGIQLSSGKWIHILNAGDTYFSSRTLQKLEPLFISNDNSILFGDVIKVYHKKEILLRSNRNLDKGQYQMPVCHQGLFIAGSIHQEIGVYDTKWRVAADFDFLLKCLKKQYQYFYINQTIATFDFHGLSSNSTAGPRENFKILLNNKYHLVSSVIRWLIFGSISWAVLFLKRYRFVRSLIYLKNKWRYR